MSNLSADLPEMIGIDPLHPLVEAAGNYSDPGVYLYVLGGGGSTIYVGATRQPKHRFAQHRKDDYWWDRVSEVVVYRIDCSWHEPPACSAEEIDQTARYLERWLIDIFAPFANAPGPIT